MKVIKMIEDVNFKPYYVDGKGEKKLVEVSDGDERRRDSAKDKRRTGTKRRGSAKLSDK